MFDILSLSKWIFSLSPVSLFCRLSIDDQNRVTPNEKSFICENEVVNYWLDVHEIALSLCKNLYKRVTRFHEELYVVRIYVVSVKYLESISSINNEKNGKKSVCRIPDLACLLLDLKNMKQKTLLSIIIFAVVFTACKKEKPEAKDERVSSDSVAVTIDAETNVDISTSKDAIDWEGEYKGIVPCEDCDGIETAIFLGYDNTFTQSLLYIGKGGTYESGGIFAWDKSGNVIELKFDDGSTAKYKVGEGKISLLDEYGYTLDGYELIK